MSGDYGLSIESNESTLDAQIALLEQEKMQFNKLEKYNEAHEISEKIKLLKGKSQKKKLLKLKNTHVSEKELVESSFYDELSQFESK